MFVPSNASDSRGATRNLRHCVLIQRSFHESGTEVPQSLKLDRLSGMFLLLEVLEPRVRTECFNL